MVVHLRQGQYDIALFDGKKKGTYAPGGSLGGGGGGGGIGGGSGGGGGAAEAAVTL